METPSTATPRKLLPEAGPSITTLMAWLSVCLLAAAWGPELSHSSRLAWSSFGMLGLTAALGLDVMARVKRARQEQTHQDSMAVVHQLRLVKIEKQTRSAQSMRDVTRWVGEMAGRYRQPRIAPKSDADFVDRRANERTACWMPVSLIPSVHCSDDDAQTGPPLRLAAYIQDVSTTGIRLCHSESVESDEAVLQVKPDNVEGVSLLLTHCWTRPTTDGWFQSGWKLLNVLSPVEVEEDVDAELLVAAV